MAIVPPMFIELRKGGTTEIDDSDAELGLKYKWRNARDKRGPNRTSYASFTIVENGRQRILLLHRLILNAQSGEVVDHIDGNGLNNKRSNLRLGTQSQNRANGRQWKQPKSGFRGVYTSGSKWMSLISDGSHKLRHLGQFQTKEDAAKAYDKAAFERWGDFARLNFPRIQAS